MCQGPPSKRKIIWIWDKVGNTGKTTLAKHLCMYHGAIYVSGKAADIKHAIISMAVKPKIVIIDCPRTSENYVSYAALESVQNGFFFSGKYEGGQCLFEIPHVIVFANFPPIRENLSADRWKVIQLDAPDSLWLMDAAGDFDGESDTEVDE